MNYIKKLLLPLLAAVLILVLIAAGSIHVLDRWTQDALYQQRGVPSGDVIIVGIDGETLSELGPYGPVYRTFMAYAFQKLASDPDHLPAVVAADILYEGESDPEVDAELAQAAAALPAVVTACMAEYGDEITWEDGHAVSLNASAVIDYVNPYDALKDVTTQGHINAMPDLDGILRHALLYVRNPDGGRTPSMAAQCARLFLESKGGTFSLPNVNAAGHYYVPFTGKPGDFYEGFTLYKLIMGQIPAEAWAGKIVLIGPYAAALQDSYFTSADKAEPMYGVEYQANVIQSLLKHNLKTEASDAVQLLVVAAILIAAAFLFFRMSTRDGGILCACLAFFGVLAAYGLYLAGIVTHVLWLPFGAALLYLAAVIAHYVQAARERRALALEKERIATELSLATRIQARFLPDTTHPFPDRNEFSVYASMDPAREVGGDLYDFFLIDDDHLCIVIGDVSGKGVPASLFMMQAASLIHYIAQHELNPGKVLTQVNEEICARNPEEMFVTVWLGVLEISTGILSAANAGHEFPALKNPDGSFDLLKDKHGFVIGGMEGIRYRDYKLELSPGSKVFVYTDGVPEATDASEQMFGTDRMISALRTKENGTPAELLSAVTSAVSDFVGSAEQFDDLTMLCLEYKGK